MPTIACMLCKLDTLRITQLWQPSGSLHIKLVTGYIQLSCAVPDFVGIWYVGASSVRGIQYARLSPTHRKWVNDYISISAADFLILLNLVGWYIVFIEPALWWKLRTTDGTSGLWWQCSTVATFTSVSPPVRDRWVYEVLLCLYYQWTSTDRPLSGPSKVPAVSEVRY